MKTYRLLVILLSISLAACATAPSAAGSTGAVTSAATTRPAITVAAQSRGSDTPVATRVSVSPTPISTAAVTVESSGAGGAGTASVSTAIIGVAGTAVMATLPPPDYTPPPPPVPPSPTAIPTLSAGSLSPAELKYSILQQFPDFFFCDPDYYPVARADETGLAVQRFPEIQADAATFAAILAHNNLTGQTNFTPAQKLLIYKDYKKLNAIRFEQAPGGYRFQIQVAKGEGPGELVTGVIDGQGKITVQQKTPGMATCPICLAAGTLIDTPAGPVAVEALKPGEIVWTVDAAGRRIAAPIQRLGRTIVPATHQVVHVVLEDGRDLWVSPGHPTTDGRTFGELRAGDLLDGSPIQSAELVPYNGYATYDLLPAGETGFYWANGILIASTIMQTLSEAGK